MSLKLQIWLHSFALFSGICSQRRTHKPSSAAGSDVNRHLATTFWCKGGSADTVFNRGAVGEERNTERKKKKRENKESKMEGQKERKKEIVIFPRTINTSL